MLVTQQHLFFFFDLFDCLEDGEVMFGLRKTVGVRVGECVTRVVSQCTCQEEVVWVHISRGFTSAPGTDLHLGSEGNLEAMQCLHKMHL